MSVNVSALVFYRSVISQSDRKTYTLPITLSALSSMSHFQNMGCSILVTYNLRSNMAFEDQNSLP